MHPSANHAIICFIYILWRSFPGTVGIVGIGNHRFMYLRAKKAQGIAQIAGKSKPIFILKDKLDFANLLCR